MIGDRDRPWLVTVLFLCACVAVLTVVVAVSDGPVALVWPYGVVALLIFGDAVLAVFPGETTLNVAATMAAAGTLDVGWVVVAGAIGAVAGDSALYAVARRFRVPISRRLEKALANDKVATAQELIGTSAPSLLVLGRYLPGMRFVVNATLGVAAYPYPLFLRWSAVGGTAWSIWCCTVAYLVGNAVEGYPIAAVAVSALASTLAFALVLLVIVRRVRQMRRTSATAPPV